MREDGPLDPARTARVGLAVLGALEAAHAQGILHRDVKPSNVLLAPAGDGRAERAVLTDFGIALSTGDASLTSSGLLLGSPAYIAPERAQGRAAGPASDLWSLGATLFTAVEGRPPYDQGDALLTVTAVVTGEHGPFARAGRLAPVLDGLLAKDPERRLTAQQATALLQEVADAPAEPAPRPDPDPDPDRTRLLSAPLAALPVGQLRGLADGDGSGTRVDPSGTPVDPAARSAPVTDRATTPGPRPPSGRPVPPVRRARGPKRAAPARRGRQVAGAVTAVVLLAGLVAGAVALTRGGGSTLPAAAPAPTPSASPSPSSSPTTPPPPAPPVPATPAPATPAPATPAPATPAATTPPATGAAPLPAGWVLRDGPAGWSAGVPGDWTAGAFGGSPEYRDPATGAVLRVSTGPGNGDPVADRQAQARSFAAAHPTYSAIAITPLTYRGVPAADWEFTYEGLHVLDRVFVVDGRGYSLYVQARQGQWDGVAPVAQQLFAAFRPAGS